MLHPGKEIMMRLEALGISQKDFSQKLGKRVSEINELIKGKRNITVAREFILSDFFKTPAKYWIYKQVDYDYEQMQGELQLKQEFLVEQIGENTLSDKQDEGGGVMEKYQDLDKKMEFLEKNKASGGDDSGEAIKNDTLGQMATAGQGVDTEGNLDLSPLTTKKEEGVNQSPMDELLKKEESFRERIFRDF